VVGELLPPGHWLAAELAGRIHGVLGLNGLTISFIRDASLARVSGLTQNRMRLVRPEDRYLADAGDARHRVVEIDVGVVAEEELVVGAFCAMQMNSAAAHTDFLTVTPWLIDILRQLGGAGEYRMFTSTWSMSDRW